MQYHDIVNSLIPVVKKFMAKFESLGVKYHEDASNTISCNNEEHRKTGGDNEQHGRRGTLQRRRTSEVTQLNNRVKRLKQKLVNVVFSIRRFKGKI